MPAGGVEDTLDKVIGMNQSDDSLRNRIATIRWALPLVFAVTAVIYQIGPAHWAQDNVGDSFHFGVEILFYGTAAPVLSFLALTRVKRWLDENEEVDRQVRASDRRLASIMSASADAILGLDVDGRIESWNLGAQLLFGYLADEIDNRPFSTLFGERAAAKVELDWLFQYVRQNGFIRGHETTCRSVGGDQIVVELTATHLVDEGKPLGMSIVLRDITDRRRRDKEIQRLNTRLNEQVAERTRELADKVEKLARANEDLHKLDQMRSEFVSLVTHQIRAPLTNMNGAAQRMQSSCRDVNPTCTRMFAIFDQQITRLDGLVQEVLNTARIETGEILLQSEPISVLPIVQQVVEETRARIADRSFHLPSKPGLPLALADRDRTAEVLTNLLDNADKYSPPDGEIAVEVRADQTGVIVSVRDYGPGIPPDDIERIFDKFYRTDSSDSQIAYGYGLGLYVCRRLIEAQGGRIWAENHPDRGAVFSFMLPVWQREND
jgi:PAS domain S-box-containing protein